MKLGVRVTVRFEPFYERDNGVESPTPAFYESMSKVLVSDGQSRDANEKLQADVFCAAERWLAGLAARKEGGG